MCQKAWTKNPFEKTNDKCPHCGKDISEYVELKKKLLRYDILTGVEDV